MAVRQRALPNDQIVRMLRESDDAFMTAPEIADRSPVGGEQVRKQLIELYEQGLVRRKEAGASAVGWWVE